MQIKHLEEKSRIGKILLKRRLISDLDLTEALVYQAAHGIRLGEALTSLNLITPFELKRALTRQYWLRSVTALTLMTAAPITPALAAGNGYLGGSSSASSQITLTILPKTQAQNKGELTFSASKSEAIEGGFCPSEWGAELFRLKLTGSGVGGGFQVSNRQQKHRSYQAYYKHQRLAFQPLLANNFSKIYSNVALKNNCQQSSSNQLKVALPNEPIYSKPSSSYNGVLTLTFSAE